MNNKMIEIPAHIIDMATRNAILSRTRINIYKYRSTYVMMPDGYAVPEQAILLAYVTAGGVYYEISETTSTSSDQ